MNPKAQALSEFLASGIPRVTVDYVYIESTGMHLFQVKRAGQIYPVRFSADVFDDSTEEYLRDLLREAMVCSKIHDQIWPDDRAFTNAGLVSLPI